MYADACCFCRCCCHQASAEQSSSELERVKASLAELQATHATLQNVHRNNTATAKKIQAKNKAMIEEKAGLQVQSQAAAAAACCSPCCCFGCM
jgi:hypothetical protein